MWYNLVKEEKLSDYWKEIPVGSDSVKRICKYDENHIRCGKGYVYDNNKISKVVIYVNGVETTVLKEFDDKIMKEYSEFGSLLYEGGYLDHIENDYCRNGEGIAFVDDQCVYDGEWSNNKRNGSGSSLKNGIAVYNGDWKDDCH